MVRLMRSPNADAIRFGGEKSIEYLVRLTALKALKMMCCEIGAKVRLSYRADQSFHEEDLPARVFQNGATVWASTHSTSVIVPSAGFRSGGRGRDHIRHGGGT